MRTSSAQRRTGDLDTCTQGRPLLYGVRSPPGQRDRTYTQSRSFQTAPWEGASEQVSAHTSLLARKSGSEQNLCSVWALSAECKREENTAAAEMAATGLQKINRNTAA